MVDEKVDGLQNIIETNENEQKYEEEKKENGF